MQTVAIFGHLDALAGQFVNFLDDSKFSVACFISIDELPVLDINEQHALRPNSKTEFVQDGRFMGRDVYVSSDYVPLLRELEIDHCFVLEASGAVREKIFSELRKGGIDICSYVHPSSMLCGGNTIGEGAIIFPRCYVAYKADVLDGTIVQSNCTIEHHSVIGRYCDINPNVTTGGFVKIEDRCEINMSVDIINRIKVGQGSRVGAGSLVLHDIGDQELWFGRPAQFRRKN